MAIIEARINESEIFKLCSWNSQDFENTQALTIQVDDPTRMENAFGNIKKIEIYVSNNLVATYTVFDSYSEMTFMKEKVFVEHENIFVDATKVVLTKKNIVEQVEKLNAQLNEVVDIEAMTIDEYRAYILKQVSLAAQEDIFAGDYVPISTGSQLFTFKLEDQENLGNMITLLDQLTTISNSEISIEDIRVPYHSSGQPCNLYSVSDMVKVYATLFMRSIQIQTYCNAINMLLAVANTKEDIRSFHYGMKLPEESQKRVDEIVATSLTLMNALIDKYTPTPSIPTDGGINEPETNI